MQSDTPSSPTSFGSYTLLRELGRGGQGTVWLAEDQRLHRQVALKILDTAPGSLAADRLVRFQREAAAAARLDDPHICGLFDAGDVAGVPYLAFRFVAGETLAERINRAFAQEHGTPDPGREGDDETDPSTRAGVQRIVLLCEQLARALHKAHEKGLIHRDVKPGNIMITPEGAPVLLDFGLARDELAHDQSLTHSGDLLGTPAYMSPEQLTAQRIPLDRRTDVYSLGATLYEALTLHRPFTAVTRAELYQQILTGDPSAAIAVNRQIPRDLQVVIETAMEKDRNRRYQTAADFAEDLRRVRAFEPIRARPISRLLRLRRWAQRHPVLAAVVPLLLFGLLLSLWFVLQLQSAVKATRARALLLAASDALPRDPHLAVLLAEASHRMSADADSFGVLHHALLEQREEHVFPCGKDRVVEIVPVADNRVVALDWDGKAWMLDLDDGVRFVMEHGGRLRLGAMAPDQRVLATASEASVCTWDLATGTRLGSWPIAEVHGLGWVPDPMRLVIGSTRGVVLLDPSTGQEERLLEATREPQFARVSADARWIASGGRDRVAIWDRDATGRYVQEPDLDCGNGSVNLVVFSPDSELLITAVGEMLPWVEFQGPTSNRTARLWRREGGRFTLVAELAGHGGSITAACFANDCGTVVTATRNGFVYLWDLEGKRLRELSTVFGAEVSDLEVSTRDGRIAAAAGAAGVHVFDAAGSPLFVLGAAADAAFVGNSARLVTGAGRSVRVWRTGIPELPTLRGHEGGLYYADFSPDGRTVVTAGFDGTARLWDWRLDRAPVVLAGHDGWVTHAEFSVGGLIATGCADGRARIWRQDGQLLDTTPRVAPGLAGYASRTRFAPDGRSLLVAVDSDGGELCKLWSVADGRFQACDDVPVRSVWGVAWAHDGSFAVGSWKHEPLRIFSPGRAAWLANPFEISIPERHVLALEYSDDKELLAATSTGAVSCDVRTGDHRVVAADGESLYHATFSPDGSRILTAGYRVALWSRAGRELARFEGHRATAFSARFAPDGKRIVTASFDQTAQIWCTDGDELLRLVERYSDPRARTTELQRYESLRPQEFLPPRTR